MSSKVRPGLYLLELTEAHDEQVGKLQELGEIIGVNVLLRSAPSASGEALGITITDEYWSCIEINCSRYVAAIGVKEYLRCTSVLQLSEQSA